jgi:hypothetical protein
VVPEVDGVNSSLVDGKLAEVAVVVLAVGRQEAAAAVDGKLEEDPVVVVEVGHKGQLRQQPIVVGNQVHHQDGRDLVVNQAVVVAVVDGVNNPTVAAVVGKLVEIQVPVLVGKLVEIQDPVLVGKLGEIQGQAVDGNKVHHQLDGPKVAAALEAVGTQVVAEIVDGQLVGHPAEIADGQPVATVDGQQVEHLAVETVDGLLEPPQVEVEVEGVGLKVGPEEVDQNNTIQTVVGEL